MSRVLRWLTAIYFLVSFPFFVQGQTCSTIGPQNIGVIMVTLPGVTPPSWVTPDYVNGLFFSETDPSLNRFWQQASLGQTSAQGTVVGWYTLNGTYSCSDNTPFITDALNAAISDGLQLQNYT